MNTKLTQSEQCAAFTTRFPRVCIVGVGLIGGSIAAALRAAGYGGQISGYDPLRSLTPLIERGLLDGVEESFDQNAVCLADLIYLAAPINASADFLEANGRLIKPGAIVTDAGSTKRTIGAAAGKLPLTVTFIGGHPMAGSERTGAEFADPTMFSGCAYILTPSERTPPDALAAILNFVGLLGARAVQLDEATHDRMVAAISQGPQLLATALAALVGERPECEELFDLAGNGYRDMTRLAASRWSVWGDICQTNSDNLADELGQLIGLLSELRAALNNREFDRLEANFELANAAARRIRQARIKPFSN